MANLNKVSLIGRLTRDPEPHTFSNGGKVVKLGFAVNNRRKNQQSGQWEDVPVWLDLKAFNRETGRKLADQAETLKKGQQIYVDGHLVLEEWASKDDSSKKNSKLVIVMDDFQYLEKKEGGSSSYGGGERSAAKAAAPAGGGDDIEEVPF